jgi:5-methylcytosine-specific restriction endonuclease McrA
MLLPKPRSQRLERAAKKAHKKRIIRQVREVVRQRDPRCRHCRALPRVGGIEGRLEMHELKSRARLRGKPPEEIFNRRNCLMLCSACHRAVTEHRLIASPMGEAGADGDVDFKERAR